MATHGSSAEYLGEEADLNRRASTIVEALLALARLGRGCEGRGMDGSAIRIGPGIEIPWHEIGLQYVRSSGPGGQNVNKVASKAVLRFDLRHSPSLPEAARQRAMARLASRLTRRGELVISCDTHRDQPRNRETAIRRFQHLLSEAVSVPKSRRPTRPSRAAKERRITQKKQRGRLKRERTDLGE